jgi:hypothetical protein
VSRTCVDDCVADDLTPPVPADGGILLQLAMLVTTVLSARPGSASGTPEPAIRRWISSMR